MKHDDFVIASQLCRREFRYFILACTLAFSLLKRPFLLQLESAGLLSSVPIFSAVRAPTFAILVT